MDDQPVGEPYPTPERTNNSLPAWCDCGFQADSLEEIAGHEHDSSRFSTEPPESE